jgi:hypothetical protein
MTNIEQLGFPVILDDSSDLKSESPVGFRDSAAVRNMPLDVALRAFLRQHNSVMHVTPHALMIYSVDEAAEELDRVVYNVSALLPSSSPDDAMEQLYGFIRVIQNSIEPESWEYEGPSAMPVVAGGQRLLVLVNTYDVHRQIRQFFGEMASQSSVGGSSIVPTAERSEFAPRTPDYAGGQF